MICKNVLFFLLILVTSISSKILISSRSLDTFGIVQFYPTKTGSREWNSAHWNNGVQRVIKYDRDTADPTDWTEDHSASTDGFKIDGNGVMNMNGGGPRFHINSLRTTKGKSQFFINTEFTGYYRRIGSSGADYGGMVVGVRSGPLGHASSGGNDCDATTYYARFRHDGNWDFEKELKHSASEYRSTAGIHTHEKLWNGKPLPENRWIGMKYLAYNIENNTKVKLELYIDSTSGGSAINDGVWKKVGEVVDNGDWPSESSPISGCSYSDPATIITEGHGTILLRTDGAGADYKMVSVREIDTQVSTNTSKLFPQQHKSVQSTVNKHDQYLNTLLGQKIKTTTTAQGRYIRFESATK